MPVTILDLGARLWLEFNRPVDKAGLENLHISEKVDTLYQPLKFTLEEDSLKIRRIYIDASWKGWQEYLLTLILLLSTIFMDGIITNWRKNSKCVRKNFTGRLCSM